MVPAPGTSNEMKDKAKMEKKQLSERDICSKYITPAIINAGWDLHSQIREEVFFTKGRVIVRGKLHTRGERKFADYVLYYKPNIALAVIEAKEMATVSALACSRH